ncbi:hypothetical protein NQZ68_000841 [Dissostichus eleginoides]|nr:hypothetical protein NQZ68_000841 [Dissostichus eleginoides]
MMAEKNAEEQQPGTQRCVFFFFPSKEEPRVIVGAVQEETERLSTSQSAAGRSAAGRSAVGHDALPQDALQDALLQDALPQDAVLQDAAGRSAAGMLCRRDALPQDPGRSATGRSAEEPHQGH